MWITRMNHAHAPTVTGVPAATWWIVWLAVLVASGLAAGALSRRLGWRPLAAGLLALTGVGAVVFQILHFAEHGLQLGHWVATPDAEPWMSSFGRAAADGLALLVSRPGDHLAGMELLHLTGNWIFLGGVLALRLRFTHRGLGVAFWLQSLHVAEHLTLTATQLLTGRSLGLSTLFGLAAHLPGIWGPSLRVWWHFLINLAVTVAVCLAVAAWGRSSATATSVESRTPRGTHHALANHTRALARNGTMSLRPVRRGRNGPGVLVPPGGAPGGGDDTQPATVRLAAQTGAGAGGALDVEDLRL